MYDFYIAKIEYYSDYLDHIESEYGLYAADSYENAMHQISKDYGENSLEAIKLDRICGDGIGLTISESLADALVHDFPDEIICKKSETRKANEAKNKEKK